MIRHSLLALGAMSMLAGPASATKPVPDNAAPVATRDVNDAVNALTEVVYALVAQGSEENFVLSGASLSGVFALLRPGARGQTRQEMDAVLHYGGIPDVELRMAKLSARLERQTETGVVDINNAAFFDKSVELQPSYKDGLKAAGAPAQVADFVNRAERERSRFNAWVSEKTNKLIPELIPAGILSPRTRLVLVNTVYMKVDWATPFDKALTQDRTFAAPDGEIEVPTMEARRDMRVAESGDVRLAAIPYADGLTMVVAMGGDATERLDITGWVDAVQGGQMYDTNLRLPKFDIESSYLDLAGMLAGMGMETLFTDEADLTGIVTDPKMNLYVTDVIQKAVIKVDETGTEAAAASAIIVAETVSIPIQLEQVDFFVDRPFAYLIHDTASDTVLFAGRVMKPS